MSLPILHRGANRILRRNLFEVDGTTPLAYASLTALVLKLYQGTQLVKTLTKGIDPELRVGATAYQVEVELTTTITAMLESDIPVTLRWELSTADSEFEVDSDTFNDVQIEQPYLIK